MKPIKRYVDLGFGKGEHIKRLVKTKKPHQVIEGIELPSAKRIKILGAKLKYIGIEEWLKKTKKNTYTGINADFVFSHIFKKYESPSLKEKKIINDLIELKEKLIPGGRIYFSSFEKNVEKEINRLKNAGFEMVSYRKFKKNELNTAYRRYHNKNNEAILISARKPREPKNVFVVSENGSIKQTIKKGIN